jgi:hypothetical protein
VNSQARQRREQADLGRDRAGDVVPAEVPATPKVGRASRRASGTRAELKRRESAREARAAARKTVMLMSESLSF